MIRKIVAIIGLFALSLSALAVPASAAPSSSQEDCEAAGGIFHVGERDIIPYSTTYRLTAWADSCDVPVISTEQVNTAHKNFAVAFEVTTVTVYSTTTNLFERYQVVGTEPGPDVPAWRCVNAQGNPVQAVAPWINNETTPTTGSPTQHPQCLAAVAAFPDAVESSGFRIESTTVPGPDVDVNDWVKDEGASDVTVRSEVLSVEYTGVGCFNLVSERFLDNINAHCRAVIDAS